MSVPSLSSTALLRNFLFIVWLLRRESGSGKGQPWIPFPGTVSSANRIDSTVFGPNDSNLPKREGTSGISHTAIGGPIAFFFLFVHLLSLAPPKKMPAWLGDEVLVLPVILIHYHISFPRPSIGCFSTITPLLFLFFLLVLCSLWSCFFSPASLSFIRFWSAYFLSQLALRTCAFSPFIGQKGAFRLVCHVCLFRHETSRKPKLPVCNQETDCLRYGYTVFTLNISRQ